MKRCSAHCVRDFGVVTAFVVVLSIVRSHQVAIEIMIEQRIQQLIRWQW